MKKNTYQEIITQCKKTIDSFFDNFPESIIEINKVWHTRSSAYLKAYLGVIYLILFKSPNSAMYVFQSFRNNEIIKVLKKEEILILGGRDLQSRCMLDGYSFFWTGGIMAAVVLAARSGHELPLKLQFYFAKFFFGGGKKNFFLMEDTTPVGAFFAVFANKNSHASILIQHGAPMKKEIFLDGILCKYNLLYQIGYKENMNPSSIYFELGPPLDAFPTNEVSLDVVLVGTGWGGFMPEFYARSLETYVAIDALLGAACWNVAYRPHPCEDADAHSGRFRNIDKEPKVNCLSGSRKIFIGYQSTLLLEAQIFGHGVITLYQDGVFEEEGVFKLSLFTPDRELSSIDDKNEVEKAFLDVHQMMQSRAIKKIAPLKKRFLDILKEIELNEDH